MLSSILARIQTWLSFSKQRRSKLEHAKVESKSGTKDAVAGARAAELIRLEYLKKNKPLDYEKVMRNKIGLA